MKKLLQYMTFYDKVFIILIIVISLFFIIYPVISGYLNLFNGQDEQRDYIVIQLKNQIVSQLSMEETYGEKPIQIEIDGPIGVSIIEAYQGRVRLKQAPPDDPLKICEKTGWIEEPGPSIVCIPNQILIQIKSEKNYDIDGITN